MHDQQILDGSPILAGDYISRRMAILLEQGWPERHHNFAKFNSLLLCLLWYYGNGCLVLNVAAVAAAVITASAVWDMERIILSSKIMIATRV